VVYFATANWAGKVVLEMASLKPTGTESQLEEMPPLAFAANWTIDRDGIYFYSAQSPTSLSYFDFVTQKVRQLYEVGDGCSEVGTSASLGLSVSPDGRYILYPVAESPNSDIMRRTLPLVLLARRKANIVTLLIWSLKQEKDGYARLL
jgi:hypothetical protein